MASEKISGMVTLYRLASNISRASLAERRFA